MRKLLFASAIMLAAIGGAAAENDEIYPYRADGPERDLYLQSNIKTCMEWPAYQRMGSKQEVKAFCNCKMLKLADSMTWDDTVAFGQYSTGTVKTLSREINAKFVDANSTCAKEHFKLPEVPKRR
jgi:hypothetical protein